MNRKDIMTQIKSDLEDNLTLANGYSVQPVVIKQGVYMWNDFKGNMPSLHFTLISDEAYEADESPSVFGGTGVRVMNLIFYGYATTDGADNSETIYEMASDIEIFLKSEHFTYADNTYLGKLETKEGGVNDFVTAFNLEVKITYT